MDSTKLASRLKEPLCIRLDMTIKSEANLTEHWSKKHKRRQNQHIFVKCALMNHREEIESIGLPCVVKLIRVSARKLDSDNLQMAFKASRDCVAAFLIPDKAPGQADNDSRIEWQYDQDKGKNQGIRIEITSR